MPRERGGPARRARPRPGGHISRSRVRHASVAPRLDGEAHGRLGECPQRIGPRAAVAQARGCLALAAFRWRLRARGLDRTLPRGIADGRRNAVSTDEPPITLAPTAGSAPVMRRSFDESFAAAAATKSERLEDLLA